MLCRVLLAVGLSGLAWGAAGEASVWPAMTPAVTSSAADEQRVATLLSQLTLEEKVAQMIQADIASVTPEDVRRYRLGSVLAGGNAAPHGDVRTSPQQWVDLTGALHRAALEADASAHPPIPLLFGIDAVHGDAKLIGATVFPHNVGLGAMNDPQLIEAIGAATAEEVASTGIDWTFAPTVAVVRDVRWGRSYESYSESPDLVARYAAAMVRGLQGPPGTATFMAPGRTLSSVKHFIGDGATLAGRDQGDSEIPESTLARVHGAGYQASIPAGALIVMASYNSWQHQKVNASHYLLTEVLKGRLGFNGFVVGDWNAQEQIPGCTKYSCPAAILAGVDMLMAPDSWKPLYFNTIAQVRSGIIPIARIDDAVTRILRVKLLSGCLDRHVLSVPMPTSVLGSPAHRALAREAVRRSLVLLKNERATLPLKPNQHILVVGAAADDIGNQSGGWTIDWQGDHNRNEDFPGATSLYRGIAQAAETAGGQAELSADGRYRQRPDVAVLVYGEGPYAEFEGDRETLALPDTDHHLAMLKRLRAEGIPTVSVLLSGRPLWVNRELNLSDAFVAAWLPGSEGEGLADVLLQPSGGGKGFDFSGRLGFSWPASAQPVTFDANDHVQGALFPVGYGLDYTQVHPLARLPEEPQLSVAQRRTGTLFDAGHVTAPWSIYLSDAMAEVRLTTDAQSAPAGCLQAELDGSILRAHWCAGMPSVLRIAGRPASLKQEATNGLSLVMDYRVLQTPSAAVTLGARCSAAYVIHPNEPTLASALADREAVRCGTSEGAAVDITETLRHPSGPGWQQLVLPLRCLVAAGADLTTVEAPFALSTAGALSLELRAVRLERRAGAKCPAGSPAT